MSSILFPWCLFFWNWYQQPPILLDQCKEKASDLCNISVILSLTTLNPPGQTVDGGWADWRSWNSCVCDYSTGAGVKTRTRSCTDPAPFCHGS